MTPNNYFPVRLRFILRSGKIVHAPFCIPSVLLFLILIPTLLTSPLISPKTIFPPKLTKICTRTWFRSTNFFCKEKSYLSPIPNQPTPWSSVYVCFSEFSIAQLFFSSRNLALRSCFFFSQVPKKCTDLDLNILYILTSGIYSKFTRKNNFLALGVCFPQPCSSAGSRFAASRSRLKYYWRIVSFPQQKFRWHAL